MSFAIADESYDSPSAQLLIEAVQQEYVTRYGGRDGSPVDPTEFAAPNGTFVVGYLDGVPVACGGLRRHADGEVEIKRMYVAPLARRQGIARLVLSTLEERAVALGASRVVLETGQVQPEAVSLYETSGYTPIDGFGFYRCAPLSLSYAKDLR